MKRLSYLLLFAFCSVVFSCIPEETEFSKDANNMGQREQPKNPGGSEQGDTPGNPVYKQTEADKAINLRIFEVINMDYPGLSEMKMYYQEGKYAKAADVLLRYLRTRTSVVNPEFTPENKSMTTAELHVAEQALEYRFAMNITAYYESYVNGVYTYYCYKGNSGKLNWDINLPDVGQEAYQIHRHVWFDYLARAYNMTGDTKYFDNWEEVLLDWMSQYPCPASTSTYSNKSYHQLDVASRIPRWIKVMQYFIGCEKFTSDFLSDYLVSLSDQVDFSLKFPYSTSDSNIRIAQQCSEVLAALLMPEFKNAPHWLDVSSKGVAQQLNDQFYVDGVHNELSFSYELGVIEYFREMHQCAVANHKESVFPSDYLNYLRNSCLFITNVVFPDYTWECFNDCFAQTKSVLLRNIQHYSEMFPDENVLLYMGSDRASGKEPETTLIPFPTGGYYVLRNTWKNDGMMLILKNNYNPKDRSHAQNDNGTFAVWYKGRNFLPDAGSYTYGGTSALNKERDTFRSTAWHNTLTKNLENIGKGNSAGELVKQGSSPGYDYVVTQNKSYSDLTHRRSVFMLDNSFYAVLDEAYGDAYSVPVNVSFHLCSDSGPLGPDVVVIDDGSASRTYGAHTEFANGVNMLFKTFTNTPSGFKGENGLSDFSLKINEKSSRKYYRVTVNKTARETPVKFLTLVYPGNTFGSLETSVTFDGKAVGDPVTLVVNGKTYTLKY